MEIQTDYSHDMREPIVETKTKQAAKLSSRHSLLKILNPFTNSFQSLMLIAHCISGSSYTSSIVSLVSSV